MFNLKKIKIKDNGVYVIDAEIQRELDKQKLSPSMISGWLASPGDWVINKFIAPLVQEQNPIYQIRGNWFHSIMEEFFKRPQDERTLENLKETTKVVSQREEYKDLLKDKENKEWINRALRVYRDNWLENAKKEKIAQIFYQGKKQEGLELFINGKIGKTTRMCLGFIDRLVEGETGLIVQDWKTGKTISDFNPKKKISDSNPFDYWRQQIFYTLLLEQNNIVVESASLIFPCTEPPTIIEIDQSNQKYRQQVVDDCEQVDTELTQAIESGYFFPFKAGKYNGWAKYFCGLGSAFKPTFDEGKLMEIVEFGDNETQSTQEDKITQSARDNSYTPDGGLFDELF